jgi:hypothetical protein
MKQEQIKNIFIFFGYLGYLFNFKVLTTKIN